MNKKFFGGTIIFIGVFLVSFGGLIIKSFETQNPWQILFWRQIFFALTIFVFLLFKYKDNFIKSIFKSSLVSLFMGVGLFFGFIAYVYSMLNTSVANVNFIMTTQVIFLSLFGFLFLREKFDFITFIAILISVAGVIIIFLNSINVGDLTGNLIALAMPLCFAGIVILVKKFPNSDLTLSGFIGSILVTAYAFLICDSIIVSKHDFLLALIAGVFQNGLPFILLILASKYISSAVIGLTMLLEAVLGPIWAYFFINDIPSLNVFIGGSFILIGVILRLYFSIKKNKNESYT
tara:strand:- start:5124 stop:5996 length:873 start_codon:yes stop_codon:yes gene_type:complete